MNTQSHYVILGAGQLGLAVMDELVARGASVKLVNRSGKIDEPLPEQVELVAADITQPEQVAVACADAQAVFFCAQPPYDRWPELFPPLVESVIEGISRAKGNLVFASNLYMYGPTEGQVLHEALPYAAQTRKGRTRASIDRRLLDAHKQGQIQVTIGRAADFYGPRVTTSAFGGILFESALNGKTANLSGNIDLPHTYTYIRDFAKALVTLSEHDEAYGHAWHVPSAPTMTTRQLVELIEAEVQQPVRVRPTGKLMMQVVGLFNPMARETVEMMYEFEEPFIVDHSRFEAAFGNGVTPHQEAIRETIAWYRTRHT
ncbi:MAG: NAD-dependent epimerase/dehydratase family protein [Chloroflexota bacterium]